MLLSPRGCFCREGTLYYIFVVCVYRLIDCFLVDSAITSLTLSPTSDFLVTSHQDDVGVYLWSNCTLFSHVPLRALPEGYQPQLLDMPTTRRKNTGDSYLNFIMESFKTYTGSVHLYFNRDFFSKSIIGFGRVIIK